MPRAAASLVRWAAVWVVFVLLWLALAGTVSGQELVAAGVGALVGVLVTLIVVRQGVVELSPRLRWIRRAGTLPIRVVLDFFLLLAALRGRLVLRRPLAGAFRAVPFPGGRGKRAAARRAVAATAGSLAANEYVLGFDEERMLVHELVPRSDVAKEVRPR